ncbi:MAG: 16S rRNA (cytosine(967)-C(5))-methyltransferase RsmB [Alphaproteobacteria bacterium]|nr:16S rRNA (cytosine(967)-C(5))-methyltransferase RsmB [Alphaproteobacteria bacterium]
MPPNPHSATAPSHPGLAARASAVTAIDDFLTKSQPLDETLERLLETPAARELPDRDRGLVRAIAMAAIRRLGTIAKALEERIERGLPNHSGQLEAILISGAAQILFLDVPDHAAVDLSVRLVQANYDAKRFTALSNAVLRRIAREKDEILKKSDPLTIDTPEWLANRWIKTYGAENAAKIAAAFRSEPAIDLTMRADPEIWAEKLNAKILPTGSLRLRDRTPVRALAGYEEGAFWVQDTAAALPVRLLDPKPGETIADLCAAPGGKTAQLALSGAHVTAVDRSEKRVSRLSQNIQRLGFSVDVVVADASLWRGGPFDAILLDAPCTATGTIRRHPDVAWLKSEEDLGKLTQLQQRLLDHSAELLKPGGRLIYCTCSLEPEEGEEQIKTCLARNPSLRLVYFEAKKLPWLGEELADAITTEGFLRTLPFMMPDDDPRLAGLDGFFAAKLKKI